MISSRLPLLALLFCGAGAAGLAQQPGSLDIVQLRPNFYMIAGAGANIAVQTGDMGEVLVDTGSAQAVDRVLAELRKLAQRPVRYIINTSADANHVGGNEKLATTGLSIVPVNPNAAAGGVAGLVTNNGGAAVFATDAVMDRMSAPTGQKSPYPTAAQPSETYSENERDIFLNGEGIQTFWRKAAHSDGDSIVFFRRSDVVVAGEVLDMNHFPMIDVAKGGSIQGEIDALNFIITITIPELPITWQEGGTLVIPAHGRICDEADVVEYRDMITIIRDVVASLKKKGMTLQQIQEANPTKEYRARFGAETGDWTTNMFVEAIYKSLDTPSAKY